MKTAQRLMIWSRQWHRWGAIIGSIPMLIIICSGLLLMQRGKFEWIQPKAQTGVSAMIDPTVTPGQVLNILQTRPETEVKSWKEVSQMTYRPAKGVWQVRTKNHYEIQIDAQNGVVLNSQYRMSTLLIELHQGNWFHKSVMDWVFFPAGVLLLVLWLSGMWLYLYPVIRKQLRKQ